MDVSDLVASVIRRLARERIVQFLAIGLLIFAIAPGARDDSHISLRSADLDSMRAAQAQKLGVARLSDQERDEVDRRAIEDELAYREALRLGLDRGDPVIRRHLVQKMLVLAEDLAGASREPTRDELAQYFQRTRGRWRIDEQLHVIHVFAARRETLSTIADAVRASSGDTPPPLGDAFPRSRDLHATRADLAETYGETFATAVASLPTGVWSAPVESRFGWHLVRVLGKDEGRPATLPEVVDRVRLEYSVELRHEAITHFFLRAFVRYSIDIDGERIDVLHPTERLGVRSDPSAED